jgi:hypothetical protein
MAASEKPRLRMDRSKPFAQIRGQRHPGDPFATAHFQQDGIHYDAHGLHLEHLLDDEAKLLVERRLKRQLKSAPKKTGAGEGSNDGDPDGDTSGSSDDVNLEAWLRGDAKYEWFKVTAAVRERYQKNLSKQIDVVDFLVNEEKVVSPEDLDPALADLLKQQG